MFRKAEPGGRCQRCRRPVGIAFWWKDGGLGWQKCGPCWDKMPSRDGNGVDVSGKIWDWVMDGEPRMVGKCDLCSEICVDRLRKKAPSKTYVHIKGKIVRIDK